MTHEIELGAESARVLTVLVKGGRIEARRYNYPHPHRYYLAKPDGFRYATTLAVATLDEMIRHKLVRLNGQESVLLDKYDLTITEAGESAALSGGVVRYEDEQPEMFGSEAAA